MRYTLGRHSRGYYIRYAVIDQDTRKRVKWNIKNKEKALSIIDVLNKQKGVNKQK